jgi:FkbM family methyltransferase
MFRKFFYKLRNLLAYCREFGVYGALSFLNQRKLGKTIYELKIKGYKNKIYCRAEGSDFAVLRQVIGHKDAAVTLNCSPDFIVDAGANVGYSSLLFAKMYPNATIVAVEPESTNCEMFRKNCSAYKNIHLIKGAIWSHRTILQISNPQALDFEFQVTEFQGSSSSEKIDAYGIIDFKKKYGNRRINLLKLDIEGAEYQIFSSNYQDWLPFVDNIIVELHDRYNPNCSLSLDRMLMGLKYSRRKIGEYHLISFEH